MSNFPISTHPTVVAQYVVDRFAASDPPIEGGQLGISFDTRSMVILPSLFEGDYYLVMFLSVNVRAYDILELYGVVIKLIEQYQRFGIIPVSYYDERGNT